MTKSAYIHIPFCKQKCNYCSFVSTDKLYFKDKYINALLTEIKTFYKKDLLYTVYFGGGTPSLLSIKDFKSILSLFRISKNAEITVEINPDTVDLKYLWELHNLGVNRLSIGVQDFHDGILKQIGRLHTAEKAKHAVRTAQAAGFKNISIDLIYGLPNQTKELFLDSLNQAFTLDVQHISLYGLKIEEGCKFFVQKPENLPNDDMQAEYYLAAIEACKKNKFKHYEVSNFAKPKFYSNHNLTYWDNGHYYGFGLSASGYKNNLRYYNEKNIEKYIQNPLKKQKVDTLTLQQQLEEEIFLGFRKINGINVKKINEKFEINFEEKYEKIIKKYLNTHIIKTKNGYKLTDKGILVSNIILSEFL